MSWFYFMASDSEFEDYDNGMVKIIKTKNSMILVGENGFERKSIHIFDCKAREESDKYFTKKKFIKHLEFYYSEESANVILAYLKKEMRKSKQIELWRVWESDKMIPEKRKVKVDELKLSDIDSIWGDDGYDNDCLVITQSYTYRVG